ncbi:MAG: MYXO-CTERM sorting domain-containing protein [Polyangiaceae bacterium]
MSTRKTSPWARRIAALASFIAVLVVAGLCAAAGRVQWSKTTIKENTDSKSWKLELKIFMAKAPDVAHVPMKFEFGPLAYYERAMMDGDKLVERKVPLVNQQDIIEGVEVGFLDPGSGKIEKGTSFSFKITRALGFEAGEYKVTIRDARNGQIVGSPITLKLEGENEVIDRRAMVFADPKDKKKKDEKKDDAKKDGDGDEKKDEASEEKKDEPAETAEDKTEEPTVKTDDKPGEVKEKPGGCGCRVADTRGSSEGALALGLLGVALFGLRRRSRA